jgi:electron transfer flavoprotein alpha subunit
MGVLVIAEHDAGGLRPATLNAVSAASSLGTDLDVLVVGSDCRSAAEAASRISGVARVLLADSQVYAHQLAENVAPLVAQVAGDYSHVLIPATTTGKNLLPRVAAMLDVAPLSDVIAIESEDTFVRPIYAGNVLATVRSTDALRLLSVRGTAFPAAAAEGGSAAIQELPETADSGLSSFVSEQLTESERPELTAADIVVSGGRGLGSAENFALVEKLADRLGAAVGASRAAVDAGYVPNDYQVGQTGKVVAPSLYLAVGISGAIQHLAGMKDSKVIVAINKDEEAPIFQMADYGLVGDLFEVVPALIRELEEQA